MGTGDDFSRKNTPTLFITFIQKLNYFFFNKKNRYSQLSRKFFKINYLQSSTASVPSSTPDLNKSSLNPNAKEFTLTPTAKEFTPRMAPRPSATPPRPQTPGTPGQMVPTMYTNIIPIQVLTMYTNIIPIQVLTMYTNIIPIQVLVQSTPTLSSI